MSYDERKLCVICAWRKNCNKKFSLEGKLHCPDFSRDLTIKGEMKDEREDKKDNSKCN